MGTRQRKQDEKNQKQLRELAAQPENKHCADCHQRGPTYINMTVGSFVCTSCSGVLRGLNPPHRVKSISMATFTPDEIEFIKSHGNTMCKQIWLGLFDGNSEKGENSRDDQHMKDFLALKYERKRWYVSPSEITRQKALMQAANQNIQQTNTNTTNTAPGEQSTSNSFWSNENSLFEANSPEKSMKAKVNGLEDFESNLSLNSTGNMSLGATTGTSAAAVSRPHGQSTNGAAPLKLSGVAYKPSLVNSASIQSTNSNQQASKVTESTPQASSVLDLLSGDDPFAALSMGGNQMPMANAAPKANGQVHNGVAFATELNAQPPQQQPMSTQPQQQQPMSTQPLPAAPTNHNQADSFANFANFDAFGQNSFAENGQSANNQNQTNFMAASQSQTQMQANLTQTNNMMNGNGAVLLPTASSTNGTSASANTTNAIHKSATMPVGVGVTQAAPVAQPSSADKYSALAELDEIFHDTTAKPGVAAAPVQSGWGAVPLTTQATHGAPVQWGNTPPAQTNTAIGAGQLHAHAAPNNQFGSPPVSGYSNTTTSAHGLAAQVKPNQAPPHQFQQHQQFNRPAQLQQHTTVAEQHGKNAANPFFAQTGAASHQSQAQHQHQWAAQQQQAGAGNPFGAAGNLNSSLQTPNPFGVPGALHSGSTPTPFEQGKSIVNMHQTAPNAQWMAHGNQQMQQQPPANQQWAQFGQQNGGSTANHPAVGAPNWNPFLT